jgi:hypothetical protein
MQAYSQLITLETVIHMLKYKWKSFSVKNQNNK